MCLTAVNHHWRFQLVIFLLLQQIFLVFLPSPNSLHALASLFKRILRAMIFGSISSDLEKAAAASSYCANFISALPRS